jgi:hypothetical protein
MKTVLKVLTIIFALAVLGKLLAGKLFVGGLIAAIVCVYFGWRTPPNSGEKS